MMEHEYKVVDLADRKTSSVHAGKKGFYVPLISACLNAFAAEGWRVIAGPTPWTDTLLVTLERSLPQGEREERAKRCLDEVITAEDEAVGILAAKEELRDAEVKAKKVQGYVKTGIVGAVASAANGSLLVEGDASDA